LSKLHPRWDGAVLGLEHNNLKPEKHRQHNTNVTVHLLQSLLQNVETVMGRASVVRCRQFFLAAILIRQFSTLKGVALYLLSSVPTKRPVSSKSLIENYARPLSRLSTPNGPGSFFGDTHF
jgi:hypothetical protein